MKKQTAVEWLFAHLLPFLEFSDPKEREHFRKCLAEAKAMEKEQMEQADINGYDRKQYQHDLQYGGAEYWDVEPKDFEQYYNETYGGDNE